jgi:hypothetical protein
MKGARHNCQMLFRLPSEKKEWLKSEAAANFRSQNDELLVMMEESRKFRETQKENAPVAENN